MWESVYLFHSYVTLKIQPRIEYLHFHHYQTSIYESSVDALLKALFKKSFHI